MIDVRSLRETSPRASQLAEEPALVDQILEADVAVTRPSSFETLRPTQKEVSKSVGRASQKERPALHRQRELAE